MFLQREREKKNTTYLKHEIRFFVVCNFSLVTHFWIVILEINLITVGERERERE